MEAPPPVYSDESGSMAEDINSIMDVANDAFDEYKEWQKIEEEIARKRKEMEEKKASYWMKVKRVRPFYEQALEICNGINAEKDSEIQELARNGGMTVLVQKEKQLEQTIAEMSAKLESARQELSSVKTKMQLVEECQAYSVMREKIEMIKKTDTESAAQQEVFSGRGEVDSGEAGAAQPCSKTKDKEKDKDQKRRKPKKGAEAAGGATGGV
jgi:hypothetical protein